MTSVAPPSKKKGGAKICLNKIYLTNLLKKKKIALKLKCVAKKVASSGFQKLVTDGIKR